MPCVVHGNSLSLHTLPSFVWMRFPRRLYYNLVIEGFYSLIHFDFSVLRYEASESHGWKVGWEENSLLLFFQEREREVAVGCRLERARPMSVQHPSPLSKLHRSCRLCPRCCVQYERENSLPAWHSVHRSKRETVNDLLCSVLTSTWRRRKNPP